MKEIELRHTDDEGVVDNIKEDCCPGNPHILFFVDEKPAVYLKLINNIPQNGFFSLTANVVEFSTVNQLTDKIRRDLKLGKGYFFILVNS